VFYLTDLENRPLDGDQALKLKERMKQALDRRQVQ
jgi:hypothetical protein